MTFLSVQMLFKVTIGECKDVKGIKLTLDAFLHEIIMGECHRDEENR